MSASLFGATRQRLLVHESHVYVFFLGLASPPPAFAASLLSPRSQRTICSAGGVLSTRVVTCAQLRSGVVVTCDAWSTGACACLAAPQCGLPTALSPWTQRAAAASMSLCSHAVTGAVCCCLRGCAVGKDVIFRVPTSMGEALWLAHGGAQGGPRGSIHAVHRAGPAGAHTRCTQQGDAAIATGLLAYRGMATQRPIVAAGARVMVHACVGVTMTCLGAEYMGMTC